MKLIEKLKKAFNVKNNSPAPAVFEVENNIPPDVYGPPEWFDLQEEEEIDLAAEDIDK